jgi:serine-type D-Ala-D-Ala carboxypeptidase (penicillin-binding protein 5/6)
MVIRGGRHARRRRPSGLFLLIGIVIVALVAAVAIRTATVSDPPLRVTRVLPASVNLPGPPPNLAYPASGQSAIAVQGTGMMGSSGGDTPAPIGSVAKVMTAYVVLKDHPLLANNDGPTVTMTPADVANTALLAASSQSVLPITAGEMLNERQLLEAMLIPSANNIATVVARLDAGSTPAFVTKMNDTAKALGMNHSTYTDPSGFDTATVSIPSDQLLLADAAMAIPTFAEIVSMPSATFPGTGTMKNLNSLVGTNGFVGVKTGSDSSAGGCLLFANHQTVDGQPVTFLGMVMGQERGQMSTALLLGAANSASQALLLSAIADVAVRPVLPAGASVLTLTNADGHHTRAVNTHPLSALGWGGLSVPLRVNQPVHPGSQVQAGQVVGNVFAGGQGGSSSPVASTATTPSASFSWRLTHIF